MLTVLALLSFVPVAATSFSLGVWWRAATTYGRHAIGNR